MKSFKVLKIGAQFATFCSIIMNDDSNILTPTIALPHLAHGLAKYLSWQSAQYGRSFSIKYPRSRRPWQFGAEQWKQLVWKLYPLTVVYSPLLKVEIIPLTRKQYYSLLKGIHALNESTILWRPRLIRAVGRIWPMGCSLENPWHKEWNFYPIGFLHSWHIIFPCSCCCIAADCAERRAANIDGVVFVTWTGCLSPPNFRPCVTRPPSFAEWNVVWFVWSASIFYYFLTSNIYTDTYTFIEALC